jgi:hypothetical protein
MNGHNPRGARRSSTRPVRRLPQPTLAVTCLLGLHGTTALDAGQVTFLRRGPQDPPSQWTVLTVCPGCGPSVLLFRPAAAFTGSSPRVTPLTAAYARLAAAGARVIDVPAGHPARHADVIPLVLPGGAA